MNSTVTVQELAIVVAVNELSPTIFNPDFLKSSGIVAAGAELARQPVYSNQAAQVVFQDGTSIAAQDNRLMFTQALGSKSDTEVQIGAIAQRCINVLQQASYQAVGINLRGYVSCKDAAEAQHYLTQTLLVPGSWHQYGQIPAQAAITYSYSLEQGQFTLSINEASLQLPEQAAMPVVLFSGNFSYDLMNQPEGDRLRLLKERINAWQGDLDAYRDLINAKFLSMVRPESAHIPDLLSVA